MAFTGVLGSPDGNLGNFVLGAVNSAVPPPPPSEPTANNDIFLSQTVARQTVLNISVTSTLALTQVGRLPAPLTAIVGYTGGQTRYVHVQDTTNNQVLYELNPDDLMLYPASTTKTMTALLLLEYHQADLDTGIVTFNGADVSLPGGISSGGFQSGDTCTWRELLIAILVQSAGDACQCAARIIGTEIYVTAGSTGNTGNTRFIERMNARATELGMSGTVYYDSWGYSRNGGVNYNIQTARSLTKVFRELITWNDVIPVLGTAVTSINVGGSNPRTLNFTNANTFVNGPTAGPAGIADANVIGGKVGEWNGDGTHLSLTQAYTAANGHIIVITTMNSGSYREMTLDQQGIIYSLLRDWPYLLGSSTSSPDTHLADVKVLIGADGSIVDESSVARTITNTSVTVGDPVVTGSTGGMLVNATTDLLSMADAADIEAGSGDFTAECWWQAPAGGLIDSNEYVWFGKFGGGSNREWTLNLYSGNFTLFVSTDGSNWNSTTSFGMSTEARNTFLNGAPRHIAVVKEGSNVALYINGERLTNVATSVPTLFVGPAPLTIGKSGVTPPGLFDEFRYTAGVARYSDQKVTIPARKFSRLPPGNEDQASDLNLTQTLVRQSTLNPRGTSNLALTQVAARNLTLSLSTHNDLSLTQVLHRILPRSVSHTITFTQSCQDSRGIGNSLSLSHSVGLALLVGRNLPQTLPLTQIVFRNQVVTKTASSSLTLTQTIKRVRPYSASSTWTPTGAVGGYAAKPGNNHLDLTQQALVVHAKGRKPNNTLALTQSATVAKSYARSVLANLALLQSKKLEFDRTVVSTATFTHNVNFVLTKTASNTLDLTQDVVEEHYKLRKMFANFQPTQSLEGTAWVFERSVESNVNFTQAVKRIIDVDASNTITFTQTEVHTNSKYVANTLTFSQAVVAVRTYGRNVIQQITFQQQDPTLQRVVNKRMVSLFQPRHHGRVVPIHVRTVTDNLALSQELLREVFAKTANNFFSLNHTVEVQRLRNFNVVHNLNLTQTTVKASTLNFNINHTITFPPFRVRDIRVGNLTQVLFPTVVQTVSPNPNLTSITPTVRRQREIMTLSVPGRTVVLPLPEFGDKEGNTDQFTMSFAIDGTIYTTVKKSGTRALGYSWDLALSKAEELKEFVWDNNSKAMTLTDWKGEIWIVRMTTNPSSFVDDLLPNPNESDSKITVSLEFEGVRIH